MWIWILVWVENLEGVNGAIRDLSHVTFMVAKEVKEAVDSLQMHLHSPVCLWRWFN